MDIWLIEDGDKTGPYPEYEIRARIRSGRCRADSPVWHDGLVGWTELGKTELFARDFQPPELPVRPSAGPTPSATSGADALPWGQAFRRFFARWFDLSLYSSLVWLAVWVVDPAIAGRFFGSWTMAFFYVPWFLVEAALLHTYGKTPGKFLLGMEVVNADGTRLSLRQGLWRSFRVLILGIGFGWNFLAAICQGLSLHAARRFGRPLWDMAGGHKVPMKTITGGKLVLLIVLWVAAAAGEGFAVFPAMMKNDPALREMIEKNPLFEKLRKP